MTIQRLTRRSVVSFFLAALAALAMQPWLSPTSGQSYPGNGYSQTAAAGKQVHDAQAAIDAMRAQINRLRTSVRAQVEQQPQWASTVSQVKKAQSEFDAARKGVFARLQKDPHYQALQAKRRSARDKLAAADNGDSQLTDADIAKATDLMFTNGLKMKKMETQALDDDARYGQAKTRLDAARSKLDQLEEQVTQALEGQPEYQQLQQQLQQTTDQLAQARQQLAQAAQAERQAREQEAKAREQQQQQSFGQ